MPSDVAPLSNNLNQNGNNKRLGRLTQNKDMLKASINK